jgi:fructose-1,6-bisphosphatase/inositol monophosphatase family enzyme
MTAKGPFADDLSLALRLADRADAVTLDGFGNRRLRIDAKPDATPVTEVDRAVEELIRDALERESPADAVVGEEFGLSTGRRTSSGASRSGAASSPSSWKGTPSWGS